MMSATDNPVAAYIRDEYACKGVEVLSTGTRTIKCTIPPVMEGLSDVFIDLVDKFDAVIDIEMSGPTGIEITIWHMPIDPTLAGDEGGSNCPSNPSSSQLDTATLATSYPIKKYTSVLFMLVLIYMILTRGDALWHDLQSLMLV